MFSHRTETRQRKKSQLRINAVVLLPELLTHFDDLLLKFVSLFLASLQLLVQLVPFIFMLHCQLCLNHPCCQ
jgi:hypothetical protein